MDPDDRFYPPSDSESEENQESDESDEPDQNPTSILDGRIFRLWPPPPVVSATAVSAATAADLRRRLTALDRTIDRSLHDLETAALTAEQSHRHASSQQAWLEGRRLLIPEEEREQFSRDTVYVEQLIERQLRQQLTAEQRCRTLASQLTAYNQRRRMLVDAIRRAA